MVIEGVEEFFGNVGEKAAGGVGCVLAEVEAVVGMGEEKQIFGAGDADIGQAALFFKFV